MAEWLRDTLEVGTAPLGESLNEVEPSFVVRVSDPSGPVRIGVWAGEVFLGGYWLPFMPRDGQVTIEPPRVTATVGGQRHVLHGFLRDFDATAWPKGMSLPHGTYTVTVDQEPDKVVPVMVDVHMTAVGLS